ncbi:alanine racemase [Flavimobilis marinus]|uniref:Alanine racemase n=1 Tax=Flavimobilis marinus TaxID=285351 RepID=A0A1I2D957_9MICO|nr:alanine racemase [Flavimobilis marinus]GHG45747.1 alanine racemase [Flavimobilis marinus]SFE77009.1 alanine racemase [Flavimobilis marinus]
MTAPGETITGVTDPYYPAQAVVDLAAIRSNIARLVDTAAGAAVMAVVKADGYGHGLVPSARAALAGGATWLGVAQPAEALALRAAGVDARLLTWLTAPDAPLADLVAAGVDVSVASLPVLDAVVRAAGERGRPARVHLEVETGLGRNGMSYDELPWALARIAAQVREGALELEGLWSHLACADDPAHPSVRAQRDAFDEAVRLAERAGCPPRLRHLANSAATLTEPRLHYDLVRPGLAVFGLSPVPAIASAAELGLRPAMRLEARLATVKTLPAGHGVSYGHAYATAQRTKVGIVPLGYADGVPRHASGGDAGPGGPVRVGEGARARTLRIAGRVCMDQVVVDLGPDALEQAGDTVVLFGDGHDGGPTAQDWADAAGTISYEITTRLGSRVPRRYLGEDA